MRRRTTVGCSLLAIGLLMVVLMTCSAGAVAVHRGAIEPPRLNIHIGAYRIVTAPVLLRTYPRKRSYGVWLFVSPPPQQGLRIERGEQLLLLPLGVD